jgi:hypothetical protein
MCTPQLLLISTLTTSTWSHVKQLSFQRPSYYIPDHQHKPRRDCAGAAATILMVWYDHHQLLQVQDMIGWLVTPITLVVDNVASHP